MTLIPEDSLAINAIGLVIGKYDRNTTVELQFCIYSITYINVIINGIVKINENFWVSVFSFAIAPIIANKDAYMKYPPVIQSKNTAKNIIISFVDNIGISPEFKDCKLIGLSSDILKNILTIK